MSFKVLFSFAFWYVSDVTIVAGGVTYWPV